MPFVIFALYILSAGLAAYAIYRHPTWLMTVMFVFAAGLGLEEYEWFLPQFFADASEWPARNFTQWFALVLRGISSPTTVIELGMVGFGRLFCLLLVIYGAYFLFKYWENVVAYVRAMPVSTLCLLLLWEACLLVSFTVFAAGVTMLFPLAGILKVLGAFVCLLYMANEVYLMRRNGMAMTPPSSGSGA